MPDRISRRQFLGNSGAAAAALAFGPRLLYGSPNGKLNLAVVGTSGMGGQDLHHLSDHPRLNVAALCDVDVNNLGQAAKNHPNAKTYRDWRKMLDEMSRDIDAVSVGIPDHMHAPVAMSAILRGKHVYCQKPLTHDLYEARKLTEAARRKKVATQMGIQIHSAKEYRTAVRILQDGAIGKVKEVHSWAGRVWSYKGDRPAGSDPVPAHLDWDLWIGTAPERPFKNEIYHPQNWRNWTDFGCGTHGDMACHIFDPVFTALELGLPLSATSESGPPPKETFCMGNRVVYRFAGTKHTAKELKLTWTDGETKPDATGWPVQKLPDTGSMFIGEKGWMLLPHIAAPQLFPEEQYKEYKAPEVDGVNHWHLWVEAALGNGTPEANFDFSGPLAESALLGVAANRVAGKAITWNPKTLKIEGAPGLNAYVRRTYRKGWEVEGL